MIRTKEYIIVKSRKMPITNKTLGVWTPVKECGSIEAYSLRDAKEVLADLKNGEIEDHSENCLYKIMEICYCDVE